METEKIQKYRKWYRDPTYGLIMCCALTAKVNWICERVTCNLYGNIEIGKPVFMDDIAAVVDADTIRKGTPENTIWTEKAKYMTIITGRGKQG